MPPRPTARILHQTGADGISRAIRRVSLFGCIIISGFLVWTLLHYWNELSTGDRVRFGLTIVIFCYGIANQLFYYVRFTESGIEQRTSFGRIRSYRYENLESFQLTNSGIRINIRGGKKLTIKRFEGNRDKITEILESRPPRTN